MRNAVAVLSHESSTGTPGSGGDKGVLVLGDLGVVLEAGLEAEEADLKEVVTELRDRKGSQEVEGKGYEAAEDH